MADDSTHPERHFDFLTSDVEAKRSLMASADVAARSDASDHHSPQLSRRSHQGQFYVGSDDELETPQVTVSSPPRNTTLSDGHLSFADLMAYQNRENCLPAADTKRLAGTSVSPDKSIASPSSYDSYNPLLHERRSLDEEFRKAFDEDHSPAEPYRLNMDFSSSALTTESPSHVEDTRYGERDFQSHRRNNVHMYQPMSTHLSARDLKTIQSAQKSGSGEKSSTKKRRQKSPLSSTDVQKISQEKRTKKKKKKAKKKKRVSLTSKLRDQPSSIPEEEEESESGEEEEEREEEESDRDEEDGDDEESGAEKEKGDDERSDLEGDQEFLRREDKGVSERVEEDGSQVTFIQEGSSVLDDKKVLFSVGDSDLTPYPSAGAAVEEVRSESSLRDAPSPNKSISPKSHTTTGTSDSSDTEGPDKTKNAVSEKKSKESKRRHKKQHRHRHHRKNKSVQIQRRMSGLKLKAMEEKKSSQVFDEVGLHKADIDEINRHRFDANIGVRKHLLHRPVKKQKMRTEIAERKVHDREPHEIFVELDEYVAGEWKETARWIKFEEDVEESEMWGKPRVASLSFHSLLELRRTIEKGAVVLDVECNNLTELANCVVDEMVKTGQIRSDDQGHVLRTLLSKHKHHMLEMGLQYNLSKASFSNFFQTSHTKLNTVTVAAPEVEGSKPLLNQDAGDVESGFPQKKSRSDSIGDHTTAPSAKDIKIMRKIPEGAESAAVLVGNLELLDQPTMAFVRLSEGRHFDSLVALPIPIRFVFVLLGPTLPDYDYHEIGRSISTLMADKEFRVMAYTAEDRKYLLRAINEFLDDSVVLPPGQLENPDLLKNISKYQTGLAQRKKREKLERKSMEEKKEEEAALAPDDDPLRRTNRCFGGLIRDVKRRYPLYWSDIKDAFNLQCLASIIFIYFAALSPAITFGGLMGEKTDGWIGVSEMILGCCIGGCAFGLFSGQPLLIVGSTGPLIVFEEAVFKFCIGSELPYLASRFWIGLWICVICIVVVAFEGSFLVRFISRFTQEIFSVLISVIFIYETFSKLAKTFVAHPLMAAYPINETAYSIKYNCSFNEGNSSNTNETAPQSSSDLQQPNTALLTTLLMFGTFIIAYFLRQFKNSKFLRSSVRRTIGDFGVPIAIVIMLGIDIAIQDVYTQKLNVPKGISPTNATKRGWLVGPLGPEDNQIPIWMIFAASIPAFLVFILIFMESHITEVIVSAKERKLKKGSGFHLNLLVLGIINVVLSTLGMPWVCCAAVRSITHTNSLTIMNTKQAPGEKPQIEGVREQRVTVFVVNACLGLSILMQPLLKEIPLAVLFGIFLYMGVTSLTGVQFVDRIEMLFMPAKHYPDYSYVKMVRTLRIHLFTLIEAICLAILWVVKSTAAQIAFPFALVLTIPLRFFALTKIFTKRELTELDNDDTQPSVTSSNLDEYNDVQVPD